VDSPAPGAFFEFAHIDVQALVVAMHIYAD